MISGKGEWQLYCKDSGLNNYELYYIFNVWCQRLDAKFAAFLQWAKKGPDATYETETYRGFSYPMTPQNYRYWFDRDHGILKRAGLLDKVLKKSVAGKKNESVGRLGADCRMQANGGYSFEYGPLQYETAAGSKALESSYEMKDSINSLLSFHYDQYRSRTQFEFYGANRKSSEWLMDVHRGILDKRIACTELKDRVEAGANALGICLLPDIAVLQNSTGIMTMPLLWQYTVELGISIDTTGKLYTRTTDEVTGGEDSETYVTSTNVTNFKYNQEHINVRGPEFIKEHCIPKKEKKGAKWKSECFDAIRAGLNPWHEGFADDLDNVNAYEKPIKNPDAYNIDMDINGYQKKPMKPNDILDSDCSMSDFKDFENNREVSEKNYKSKPQLMKADGNPEK